MPLKQQSFISLQFCGYAVWKGLSWAGSSLFQVILVGLTHMSGASARVVGEDGEVGKSGINGTAETSPCAFSRQAGLVHTVAESPRQKQERAGPNL